MSQALKIVCPCCDTRIVVDPSDPNAAFVSYSGFNTLTPATPGHVFRVVFNAPSGQATFTSMDLDLGDLPQSRVCQAYRVEHAPRKFRHSRAGVAMSRLRTYRLGYQPAQALYIDYPGDLPAKACRAGGQENGVLKRCIERSDHSGVRMMTSLRSVRMESSMAVYSGIKSPAAARVYGDHA